MSLIEYPKCELIINRKFTSQSKLININVIEDGKFWSYLCYGYAFRMQEINHVVGQH